MEKFNESEKYSFKKRVVNVVRPSIPKLLQEDIDRTAREKEEGFENLAKELYDMHQTEKKGVSRYTLKDCEGSVVVEMGNAKYFLQSKPRHNANTIEFITKSNKDSMNIPKSSFKCYSREGGKILVHLENDGKIELEFAELESMSDSDDKKDKKEDKKD